MRQSWARLLSLSRRTAEESSLSFINKKAVLKAAFFCGKIYIRFCAEYLTKNLSAVIVIFSPIRAFCFNLLGALTVFSNECFSFNIADIVGRN